MMTMDGSGFHSGPGCRRNSFCKHTFFLGREAYKMLRIAFINEAVTLLEEADPQDYEAIICILLAYPRRRSGKAQ